MAELSHADHASTDTSTVPTATAYSGSVTSTASAIRGKANNNRTGDDRDTGTIPTFTTTPTTAASSSGGGDDDGVGNDQLQRVADALTKTLASLPGHASFPGGRVPRDEDQLELLHRRFPWIPGRGMVRPTEEVKQLKALDMRQVSDVFGGDMRAFLLWSVFGDGLEAARAASQRHERSLTASAGCGGGSGGGGGGGAGGGGGTDTAAMVTGEDARRVFVANKYPYQVPYGTRHYVLWYVRACVRACVCVCVCARIGDAAAACCCSSCCSAAAGQLNLTASVRVRVRVRVLV